MPLRALVDPGPSPDEPPPPDNLKSQVILQPVENRWVIVHIGITNVLEATHWISQFVYLFVYLFKLFIYLFIYSLIYLFIYLFVYLFVNLFET